MLVWSWVAAVQVWAGVWERVSGGGVGGVACERDEEMQAIRPWVWMCVWEKLHCEREIEEGVAAVVVTSAVVGAADEPSTRLVGLTAAVESDVRSAAHYDVTVSAAVLS